MKVLKVINNNVVSCVDERGREAVVMGKGLGFQAKPGSLLDPKNAEKIFRMENKEEAARWKELLARLSPELLELCSQIILYATKVLGHRLNESIYLTLTDHIQFAITRCRQGMDLHNALETEARVFYPEEYTIGCYALSRIAEKMKVELPQQEAASIALHLVNAEYDSSMNATMRAAQLLRPVVEILRNAPGLALEEASLYYDELLVHLKFMAMETFSKRSRNWTELDLGEALSDRIPRAWECARSICSYLSEQSGNPVPPSEQAYLAICIHRASVTKPDAKV